jgi:hypothetical protein
MVANKQTQLKLLPRRDRQPPGAGAGQVHASQQAGLDSEYGVG